MYRVAGIPSSIDSNAAVAAFLDKFFASDDPHTTVQSLGPHPQRDSLVAIIGFLQAPSLLSAGGFWRLEKPIDVGGRYLLVCLKIDT